jgi:hypothetical protein
MCLSSCSAYMCYSPGKSTDEMIDVFKTPQDEWPWMLSLYELFLASLSFGRYLREEMWAGGWVRLAEMDLVTRRNNNLAKSPADEQVERASWSSW